LYASFAASIFNLFASWYYDNNQPMTSLQKNGDGKHSQGLWICNFEILSQLNIHHIHHFRDFQRIKIPATMQIHPNAIVRKY